MLWLLLLMHLRHLAIGMLRHCLVWHLLMLLLLPPWLQLLLLLLIHSWLLLLLLALFLLLLYISPLLVLQLPLPCPVSCCPLYDFVLVGVVPQQVVPVTDRRRKALCNQQYTTAARTYHHLLNTAGCTVQ